MGTYRNLEPNDPDWLDDDDLAERREERAQRELDRADEYHDDPDSRHNTDAYRTSKAGDTD